MVLRRYVITNMFQGCSAWFSQSVRAKRKRLWKQHGGEEVDFDHAQFIFSEQSECNDTKRLYESDAYLTEHLAIFHASYITECVKKEDIKKVVIGKYFLPPTDVQKLTKMNWEWEKTLQNEETSDEDDGEVESRSKRNPTVSSQPQIVPPNTMVTRNKDDVNRKRPATHPNTTVAQNKDYIPQKRLATHPDSIVTRNKDIIINIPATHPDAMATRSKQKASTLHLTTNSNDSVHIDTLPRITGAIEDLIQGQSGFELYLKTS